MKAVRAMLQPINFLFRVLNGGSIPSQRDSR
jgi:hypothetical protein